MIRSLWLFCAIYFFLPAADAQKYFTRDGKISFYSEAPMEKIEAHNNSVTSVIDFDTGNLEFAVLIKAFQFEKALMQEHFNENYMESSKFPKATFKGQIEDYEPGTLLTDGEHAVTVAGELTMHGVSREVNVEGIFQVQGKQVSASASFDQEVADYDIEIPALVRDKIAKTVTITVNLDYEPFDPE